MDRGSLIWRTQPRSIGLDVAGAEPTALLGVRGGSSPDPSEDARGCVRHGSASVPQRLEPRRAGGQESVEPAGCLEKVSAKSSWDSAQDGSASGEHRCQRHAAPSGKVPCPARAGLARDVVIRPCRINSNRAGVRPHRSSVRPVLANVGATPLSEFSPIRPTPRPSRGWSPGRAQRRPHRSKACLEVVCPVPDAGPHRMRQRTKPTHGSALCSLYSCMADRCALGKGLPKPSAEDRSRTSSAGVGAGGLEMRARTSLSPTPRPVESARWSPREIRLWVVSVGGRSAGRLGAARRSEARIVQTSRAHDPEFETNI